MAAPNLSELLTSTLRNYSAEIADNITANNAILTWLAKAGNIQTCDGGTTIDEALDHLQNPNGGSFSGYDVLPMSAAEVLTSASFGWKEYAVPVMISQREMGQNSGRSKIFDLMKARIKNAKASMSNLIATDAYGDGTGNSGKVITGLAAAVPADPTTGTYGDISRSLWPFWRSQLEDTAATITTATVTPAMNSLHAKCTRGTNKPKLILAGTSAYQIYEATLQNLVRFTDSDKATLGFTALKYKDADVVLDGGIGGNQSAYRMHFLNTDFLKWRPHKDYNMVPSEKRTPVNQMAEGTFLYFMGNMTCSGAQFQGLLIGD